jgi:hypothetical protein
MAFNEHAGRKSFADQVAAVKSGKAKPEGPKGKPSGPGPTTEGEGTTTITHKGDGTHSIQHHDGETSEHPSMGHAAMHLAMKHDGGDAHGHIHAHDGGATTHHVGMDGEVQGPHEHGSVEEGMGHLASAMEGGGGEENAMPGAAGGMGGGGDYGLPA